MGLLGAIFMGGIVYWINADHGFWAAIPAALKQATYTSLAGGFLSRLCEKMACRFENKVFSILMGVIIPATLAVIMTYIVHIIRGTPEPLNSTIPTMFLAPSAFLVWGWRVRSLQDRRESTDEVAPATVTATSQQVD